MDVFEEFRIFGIAWDRVNGGVNRVTFDTE
jgi:hypothetical protein